MSAPQHTATPFASHEGYMQQCLALGRQALAKGNPPVGALLVAHGKVIGQGQEAGKSTQDITNHAEILAIRHAIAQGHRQLLDQAVLYTTHEPCLMCSYVLRHHMVPHIVYGTAVEHVGGHTSALNVLTTETVPKWGTMPRVTTGVCQAECLQLNQEFNTLLSSTPANAAPNSANP